MSDPQTDVKEVFLGALDCATPGDVAHYLDAACAGNAELRARVEELLSARHEAGSFLGGDWSPASPEQLPLDETPGAVIGPYKLLEQIGEGGFGVVFRAEQQRPVRRDVALKIIKLGMDTRQVVARFEAERQALALMDHPGIAKVFDAGATDGGRPYFVMELVPGESITDYCDRQRLGIEQRLHLFVQVCQAVQHAHQKGLIHRDIKPTNILVVDQDSHATAKVIDFGIAKATQARLTEKTLFTDFRQLIGTPEYMSPEQAGNPADVDTRSDVYSLGVLLYELLTGGPPFDPKELRSKAFAEVQRIIREVEPPKPSTRLSELGKSETSDGAERPPPVSVGVPGRTLASVAACRAIEPRKMDSVIRGDLDWITMKALDKDRSRRYESAAALAADVMHHLADEPVAAAAPTRIYRIAKFVRRNKLAVLASSAVLAALVVGVIGTTIGMIGQARQRAEAEDAKEQLQAVNEFLTDDVLSAAEPSRLPDKSVRDEIVRVMIDPAAATVGERFRDKPLVEAAVRHALSSAYESVGRGDLALPHARAALAIRRRELGDDDPDTLESVTVLGVLLRSLGQYDEALPLLRESLQGHRRVLGDDDPATIVAITSMAIYLQERGRFAEAEPLYREALGRTRPRLGDDDELTIMAVNNLGYVLLIQGKLAEAEPLVVEAFERAQRVLRENHRGTMKAMANMGMLCFAQGNLREAADYWRDGLERCRRVLGNDDPYTMTAISDLGSVLLEQGEFDEAERLANEALERRQRVLGETHPDALASVVNLGLCLRRCGKLDDAERISLQAVEQGRRELADNHPATLYAITNLGTLFLVKREFDRAEPLLVDLLDRCQRALPPGHPLIATAIFNLADLRHSQGATDEARYLYQQALELRRLQLGPAHPDTIYVLHSLAILLYTEGQIEQTEPMFREALAGYTKAFGPDHWQVGVGRMHLGRALTALETYDEAETELSAANRILRDAAGPHEERRQRLAEAFVELYEQWNTAEPGKGYDAMGRNVAFQASGGDRKYSRFRRKPVGKVLDGGTNQIYSACVSELNDRRRRL